MKVPESDDILIFVQLKSKNCITNIIQSYQQKFSLVHYLYDEIHYELFVLTFMCIMLQVQANVKYYNTYHSSFCRFSAVTIFSFFSLNFDNHDSISCLFFSIFANFINGLDVFVLMQGKSFHCSKCSKQIHLQAQSSKVNAYFSKQ